MEKIILEDIVVKPDQPTDKPTYRPMETRVVDLLHTRLALSFDYSKQWVYGTALLQIKPYFYPVSEFTLDAQGFDLQRLASIKGKDTLALEYTYNNTEIQVHLPKPYKNTDTLQLWVQYIAKPNEIKAQGGKAISDSRGLYFINPLGTDPNKPRQIWSQGETEYNSCWFPTIDAPNEKHTQDIYLTVDSADITLSNGLLLESKAEKNSKRTDHWQQLKPHAPYLTMIAIGDFKVTKDRWKNKEVSYYLEPEYAPYARTIFGKTPQMIETFSRITGVEYPWDKFSQIVCRDFVSGAMENTSAVVHYEMVQHTNREHLDNPHEDIIVHELFHHWFGDLVTCRSWSNLPLNESFATYGEYLYNEATYGKDFADMHFAGNLEAYLRNKAKQRVSPVRKIYAHADDVFDVVSYQKGGWILHYLRSEVGDSAFFKGINRYLTQNAFGITDIHHLRHAMEWASGKDLQLFFKQWFEGIGHPEIDINLSSNEGDAELVFDIKQIQDSTFGIFDLNLELACVWGETGKAARIEILPVHLNKHSESLRVPVPAGNQVKLLSYWFDPKGNLPGIISEKKPLSAWQLQVEMATSYSAKQKAIKAIRSLPTEQAFEAQKKMIRSLLDQPEFYHQLNALKCIEKLDTFYTVFENDLLGLARNSSKAELRESAYELVGNLAADSIRRDLLLSGLKDSSFAVISTCLQGLSLFDEALCMQKCKEFESQKSGQLQRSIAWLYANFSKENQNPYFASVLGKYGLYRGSILNAYGNYLSKQPASVQTEGFKQLMHYYKLSSDREKSKVFAAVCKSMQNRSKDPNAFTGEEYKELIKLIESEN